MQPRKVPIKDLLDRKSEKPLLEAIYSYHGVALDQLKRVPQVLRMITNTFNRVASRSYEPSLLHRYMVNRRKGTDWVRLGAKARKFENLYNFLPEHEVTILKSVYLSLDLPSDEFLFIPSRMLELAHRFAAISRRRVAGQVLLGVIVARRKRGEWPKIRTAWGDIPDVLGM
jgi:hypothetical protein